MIRGASIGTVFGYVMVGAGFNDRKMRYMKQDYHKLLHFWRHCKPDIKETIPLVIVISGGLSDCGDPTYPARDVKIMLEIAEFLCYNN